MPVDEYNRIVLSLSPLLIRAGGRKIVVDVGYGSRHTEKDLKIWGFDPEVTVVTALADESLEPADIDTVILTHLHADHAAQTAVAAQLTAEAVNAAIAAAACRAASASSPVRQSRPR